VPKISVPEFQRSLPELVTTADKGKATTVYKEVTSVARVFWLRLLGYSSSKGSPQFDLDAGVLRKPISHKQLYYRQTIAEAQPT